MKKFELGNIKDWKQIETLMDMNDGRFNTFKQYLLQTIENLDKPLFLRSFEKYVAFHDAGQHSAGLIELYNFKKAMELKELDYDAYTYCFALLCLKPGEDQQDTSEGTQIEKIKELHKNGLTRGMIEEVVENFMNASARTFGVYLQVLEMMKPLKKEIN